MLVHNFQSKCSDKINDEITTALTAIKLLGKYPAGTQFSNRRTPDGSMTYLAILPNGTEIKDIKPLDRAVMNLFKDCLFDTNTNAVHLVLHVGEQVLCQLDYPVVCNPNGVFVSANEAIAVKQTEIKDLNTLVKNWKLPSLS